MYLSEAAERYTGEYRHWDLLEMGWKYNMDDIHAALLVDQIDRVDQSWERRKKLWEHYDDLLAKTAGIQIPEVRGESARHLYTIWVAPLKRDQILHKMQARGIGVAVNYRAVHILSYFKNRFNLNPHDFPVAHDIGECTISLPFYPSLSMDEIDYIAASLKEIL